MTANAKACHDMKTGTNLFICPDADRECGKLNPCGKSADPEERVENLCLAILAVSDSLSTMPLASITEQVGP